MSLKIAILASGNGTNAQSMIDKMQAGLLNVHINLIASNKPDAPVLERAKRANIPFCVVDHRQFARREAFDLAMVQKIQDSGAEAVILAGYMRLLSATFFQVFSGAILNLHPALLPSFPGLHGGADALAYGVKISGATVHFVEEKMDSGPVIIQAAVPVQTGEDTDSLMQRIHNLEHRIYPQAVQWLAEGRLTVKGRQTYLAPAPNQKGTPPLAEKCLIWPPLEEGF